MVALDLTGGRPWSSAGQTGAWLEAAAGLFRERLGGLSDSALDEPARVAGWSRRHVLGHLHHNALVLGRLARSVALGEPQAEDAPLERWRAWGERSERMPARHLRDLVSWAEEDLEAAFADLDAAARASRVAEMPGVRVPAEKIPWLRVRELVIHLADLDQTVDLRRLPSELLAHLAADLVGPESTLGVSRMGRTSGRLSVVDGDEGALPFCAAILLP